MLARPRLGHASTTDVEGVKARRGRVEMAVPYTVPGSEMLPDDVSTLKQHLSLLKRDYVAVEQELAASQAQLTAERTARTTVETRMETLRQEMAIEMQQREREIEYLRNCALSPADAQVAQSTALLAAEEMHQKRYQGMTEQTRHRNEQLHHLKQELAELKTAYTHTIAQADARSKEREMEHGAVVDALKRTIDTLQAQISEYNEEEQVVRLQADNQRLRMIAESTEDELNEAHRTNLEAAVRASHDRMQVSLELSDLQKNIKELKGKETVLRNNVERLRGELKKEQRLRREGDDLVRSLRAAKTRFEAQHAEVLAVLQHKVDEKTADVAAVRQECDAKCTALEMQLGTARREGQAAQAQLSRVKNQLRDAHARAGEGARNAREEMSATLSTAREEIAALQRDRLNLRTALAQREDALASLGRAQDSSMAAARQDVLSYKSERDIHKATATKVCGDLATLEAKLDSQASRIARAEHAAHNAERERDEAVRKVESLEHAVNVAREAAATMRQKWVAAEREAHSVNKQDDYRKYKLASQLSTASKALKESKSKARAERELWVKKVRDARKEASAWQAAASQAEATGMAKMESERDAAVKLAQKEMDQRRKAEVELLHMSQQSSMASFGGQNVR